VAVIYITEAFGRRNKLGKEESQLGGVRANGPSFCFFCSNSANTAGFAGFI